MYLSLSLKTESCINQRSRGLEATLATCEVYMASVCLRVQPCTSQPSCDLKGRTGCELHDLYSLQLLLPLPICQHTHTHTTVRHGKGFWISTDQTLETWKVSREWSHSFVWEERAFSLEKNQVFISLFHLLNSIDKDSVNTFLIHNLNPIFISGDSIGTSMERLW